jgi:hypothetical protein
MSTENNSSKIEKESPLKNHPLYENTGDDLVYRLLKEIQELKCKLDNRGAGDE